MTQRHVVLARWSCDILQNPKCLEVLTAQKILAEFVRFQNRLILDVSEIAETRARLSTLTRFNKLFAKVCSLFFFEGFVLIHLMSHSEPRAIYQVFRDPW